MDEVAHARLAGGWARESGRELKTCPMFGPGEIGRPQRESWQEGFLAKDAEMKSRPPLHKPSVPQKVVGQYTKPKRSRK